MIASSRVQSSFRAARPRLGDRLAGSLAAVHRLLEDVVLPSLASHPALSFRDADRG
jgi:hypothetical protein